MTTPDRAALREAFRVELAVLDVPWPSHKRALEALDRALDATPAPEAPTAPTADVLLERVNRAWDEVFEAIRERTSTEAFGDRILGLIAEIRSGIDARLAAQPEPESQRGHAAVFDVVAASEGRFPFTSQAHDWTTDDHHAYEWCRVCLTVRQRDGSSDAKPCKGPVHVGLRLAAQPEPSAPEGLDVEPTFIGSEFCAPHYHVAGPNDACGECGHDLRALCHHREATR